MPEMDGPEATAAVGNQQIPSSRWQPMPAAKQRSLAAGMDGYLTKAPSVARIWMGSSAKTLGVAIPGPNRCRSSCGNAPAGW